MNSAVLKLQDCVLVRKMPEFTVSAAASSGRANIKPLTSRPRCSLKTAHVKHRVVDAFLRVKSPFRLQLRRQVVTDHLAAFIQEYKCFSPAQTFYLWLLPTSTSRKTDGRSVSVGLKKRNTASLSILACLIECVCVRGAFIFS